MTVEELNVLVKANTLDFKKQFADVNRQLGNFKSTAENTSGTVTAAFKAIAASSAVATVAKLFSKATTAAGELEQNIGGSSAVFKEYANSIQKIAKAAYSSLGLSESAYLATANKMGALFQGSGFTVQKSADMTQKAMQRAAEVASIMGVDVKSAMESVAGAAKGNFTMMDNLGVAINDTTLKIYAQEKGLGELKTTQDKVNAAMRMFIDKTDYAAGNYAKENSTYAGALTTLKAQLENFAAEAGTALLPLAASVLPVVTDVLTAVKPAVITLSGWIGSLGNTITDISDKIKNATPAQQTALKIALAMAVAIPAVTVATKALSLAKAGYAGVLGFLIPKQLTFGSALKATMGRIGLIAGALSLLGIVSNKTAEKLDNSAVQLHNEEEKALNTASAIDDMAESTDGLTDSVKRSVTGFDELNRLGGNSGTLCSSIISDDDTETLENYKSEIDSLLDTASSDIIPSIDLDSIYSNLTDLWEWVTTDGYIAVKAAVGKVGNTIGNVWELVFGNADTKYNSLKNINEDVKNLFGEDWTNFLQGVGQEINDVFNGMPDEVGIALKSLDDKFKEFFGPMGDDWSDFWQDIGKGLWNLVNGDIASGLKVINDKFVSLFGTLGKEHSKLLQGIGGGLYEILNAGEINDTELMNSSANARRQTTQDAYNYMLSGYSAEDALIKAKDKNLTTSELLYAWDKFNFNYDVRTVYRGLLESGQIGKSNTFNPYDYYSPENQKKIHGYAQGGFPDYGDLFVANENGAEMVGSIGGRTAVANNSQIENAIYNAVKSAMSEGGAISGDIHVTVEIDGDVLGETVARYDSKQSRKFNGR